MVENPRLLSLATAVPAFRYRQEETREWARGVFAEGLGDDLERLLSIYDNAGVRTRHLAAPLEWLAEDHTFAEKNDVAVERVLEMASKAARRALDTAGVDPGEVGSLVFVTNSPISAPSLDYRIVFELGLPEETLRVPIWGRGCAGGAVGLGVAADLARSRAAMAAGGGEAKRPDKTLLVVAESCSLTFVRSDQSKANFLSTALFADGAAAAVVGPAPDPDHPAAELLDSYSVTWPNTQDVMGFTLIDEGLKVDLSPRAPAVVRRKVPAVMDAACARLGLAPEDLVHLAVHPGGPKILESFERALGIGPERLALSREVLAEYGNMSSATVLFILKRLLETAEPAGGAPGRRPGAAAAMGPGFSAELVMFGY